MPRVLPPDPSRRPAAAGQPVPTRLESVEEIRQALQARYAAPATAAPLFRPVGRPPMAVLCILDDGREDGEWVRLRADRLVIGREDGDVRIPHDTQISARHAELVRRQEQGGGRWYLVDLRSTNGTFVRVVRSPIQDGQELLLGGRRYRFTAAGAPALADLPRGTQGWQRAAPGDSTAALVELSPTGGERRIPLPATDVVIGRDRAQCHVVLDDPLVCPRHLRLVRDKKGWWHVINLKSVNGVWLRVAEMPLEGACQFQLGEQRFLVGIL
jgi:pSer/pThr/pTyr-binding forkhead associated (FHA) protein